MLLGVALECHFGTLAHEPLATLAATAAQDGATALGGHAGTETMLLLACALRWTICRTHDLGVFGGKVCLFPPAAMQGGVEKLDKIDGMSTIQSENCRFFREGWNSLTPIRSAVFSTALISKVFP